MIKQIFASQRTQLLQIDFEKQKLEKKYTPKINKIFNTIAEDVSSLLRSNIKINSKEIADNYKPDFIAQLREIYRESIDKFGFTLRKQNEKKLKIDFQIKNNKKIINKYLKENKDILAKAESFEVEEDKEKQVNKAFFSSIVLFVNNQSESQTDKISNTNEKEIDKTLFNSEMNYSLKLEINKTQQEDINSRLNEIIFSLAATEETIKRNELLKEQRTLSKTLNSLKESESYIINNKNNIVADDFKKSFKNKGKTRSKVISEYEIGHTESWVRNEEGIIVNDIIARPLHLIVKKNWDASLDSKTRSAHADADFRYRKNPIPVTELFIVRGEGLRFARDPNGSPENIINCRCQNYYSIDNIIN